MRKAHGNTMGLPDSMEKLLGLLDGKGNQLALVANQKPSVCNNRMGPAWFATGIG
jgi:hypothetical protein